MVKDPLLILAIVAAAFYAFGYYKKPFLYAGFLCQSVYLLLRGLQLERLPLVGPHDTLFFLSASTMLFGFAIGLKMKESRNFFNVVTGLAVFFIFLSLLSKPHNHPLPPVLRTFWFETHVAFSFFSYALFGIAAILGVQYLIEGKKHNPPGNTPLTNGDTDRLQIIESLQYKSILVAYFLFSTAMIFGGIWAFLAWGTYWLWTPKELWTVILWLFYSLYLHARLRNWWAGRPSAVLGIIGFAVVMFTYLGVSLLMKSSHTF